MNQPIANVDSIAHLLKSSNKLKYNLAGHQISKVLDTFLLNSLEPIVHNSIWFLDELAQIYSYIAHNARRRYSPVTDRPQILASLFASFFMQPEDRYNTYVKVELERGFHFYLVTEFLEKTSEVESLMAEYVELNSKPACSALQDICFELGISLTKIGPAYRYAYDNLKYASEFKSLIIGKYTMWAAQRAWADGRKTDVPIDFTDLFKNYVMQITAALDRYSHHNGTLATYLQYWLINAKTNPDHSHEVGQAYTMTALERKKFLDSGGTLTNLGTCLHDLDEEMPSHLKLEDEIIENMQNTKLFARLSRVRGIELAYLNKQLPYTLTAKDFCRIQYGESGKITMSDEPITKE